MGMRSSPVGEVGDAVLLPSADSTEASSAIDRELIDPATLFDASKRGRLFMPLGIFVAEKLATAGMNTCTANTKETTASNNFIVTALYEKL